MVFNCRWQGSCRSAWRHLCHIWRDIRFNLRQRRVECFFTEDWRLQSRPRSNSICIWLISFGVPCGWAEEKREREWLPHYYHSQEINRETFHCRFTSSKTFTRPPRRSIARQTLRRVCKHTFTFKVIWRWFFHLQMMPDRAHHHCSGIFLSIWATGASAIQCIILHGWRCLLVWSTALDILHETHVNATYLPLRSVQHKDPETETEVDKKDADSLGINNGLEDFCCVKFGGRLYPLQGSGLSNQTKFIFLFK